MPEASFSRGAHHPPTAVPPADPASPATTTSTTAGTTADATPGATPDATAGPDAPGAGLLGSLAPLLAEWLPRQRWFAGKGRPVTGFALVSATEILPCPPGGAAPGLLHLLIRAQQPEPPGHRHGFGCGHRRGAAASDCYQMLLGIRSALPPSLAPALIGRPGGGPLAGRTVYEALADPRLASVLLERLRVPGRLGTLRFVREPSSAIPSVLPPRLMTAEQSNSSVVYGDTFILKLFRRVSPGTNPDLELPLALARAGCARVPAPAAWFEADPPPEGPGPRPEPFTLGVLQPYLAGSTDGWQLALDALSVRADFTGPAHALGRATAEVHLAMARALPASVLRRPQIEHLAAAMSERLDSTAAAVPVLQPYRAALHAAYEDVAALGRAGRTWAAQRIHGDLHLGQALLTAEGQWSLIDFEGEPSRPLAERRRPQPPVRDIAGMLRSFDYAAAVGGHDAPRDWAGRMRAAYCAGYAEASGTDPRDEPELLRAHETDKAVYEVLYEARHRPDWLPVPMTAIRRLAAAVR